MALVWLVEPQGVAPGQAKQSQLASQLRSLGHEVVTTRHEAGAREVDAALVPVEAIVALDTPTVAYGEYFDLLRARDRDELSYLVEHGAGNEGLGKALHAALQPRLAVVAELNDDERRVEDIVIQKLTERNCTPREIETVMLRMQGLSQKETAERLGLTEKTVKVHTTHACAKFGVHGVSKLRQIVFPMGPPMGPQPTQARREKSDKGDRLAETARRTRPSESRAPVALPKIRKK